MSKKHVHVTIDNDAGIIRVAREWLTAPTGTAEFGGQTFDVTNIEISECAERRIPSPDDPPRNAR